MTARRHLGLRERSAIFLRAFGCCHLCKQKIGLAERWDIEHVIPLEMGGDEGHMAENLQPAHVGCHRVKTSVDSWQIAKAKRRAAKHLGVKAPRSIIPGSKASPFKRLLSGQTVRRDA
jgi:5-methylcytosine-specific restriction endonuclease McrA